MEYAKDKIFEIRYNEKNDKLEFKKDKTSKLLKYLSKNKFISIITTLTIVFSMINIILIYNFFTILKII